jgi:hypothetical protein
VVPVALVIMAVCSIPHFRRDDTGTQRHDEHGNATRDNIPHGWREINMSGIVTYGVPPGLETGSRGTSATYRKFGREGVEVYFDYTYTGASATCIDHKEERLNRDKVSKTEVGGKDATLLRLERAAFGPTDTNETELLKGLTICVPNVDGGEHEFAIAARYKTEQDYQVLQKILGTIKFH